MAHFSRRACFLLFDSVATDAVREGRLHRFLEVLTALNVKYLSLLPPSACTEMLSSIERLTLRECLERRGMQQCAAVLNSDPTPESLVGVTEIAKAVIAKAAAK